MADTGEDREIKARTDAKEAEVVAESKKLLQKCSDLREPDIAQTPPRQSEGNPANERLAEWLQVTRIIGLGPFSIPEGKELTMAESRVKQILIVTTTKKNPADLG